MLLAGVVGAFMARFEPNGMAKVMFATAVATMLVPMVAIGIFQYNTSMETEFFGNPGIRGIFILTGVFAAMFAISGVLFRASFVRK